MKLQLKLVDETGAIWIVEKEVDKKACVRMQRENYEMALMAAEDQLIQEVKSLNKKSKKEKDLVESPGGTD